MTLYALTIFASAFLLFLLQLVTAKQILPWFGGSAAVWTTCLVFFQSMLLFGYAYSDWSIRRFSPKRQAVAHAVLLAASLALLPIIPDAGWKPSGDDNPAWHILGLLTVTIGLPYFLLSSTSPLIQAWFARTFPNRNPYRLFALSNFASMLALLGYPLAIEPWLATKAQAYAWSVGYTIFAALCCATAWRSLRAVSADHASSSRNIRPEKRRAPDATEPEPYPTLGRHLLWCTLAAMGSILLLAVTNHLSRDIVAAPLLWVLPLSIYLLTFIMCFDGHGWYRRNLFLGLLAVFLCAMAWWQNELTTLRFQIGLFSVGLFVACMFCHGELNRLRPAPSHLTRFYLMVSLGGAVGALLVGIVAPIVLSAYYELGIGIVVLAALGLYQVRENKLAAGIGAGVLLFTIGTVYYKLTPEVFVADRTVLVARNFYGVLRVLEYKSADPDLNNQRILVNEQTIHGQQYPSGRLRRAPTSYYKPNSGIGLTLSALTQPGVRVGIIGLGVGTIASYGRPGDTYRFYEIDPAVIQVAQREFTFLKDSAAKIETVLGDARLNLEREPSQRFDVLVVDAFSSDAIPMHLITNEALTVYLKHLRQGGIIAFHVTNKYLELRPVIKRLADEHNLKVAYIANEIAGTLGTASTSHWMLLTSNQAFLDLPVIDNATFEIPTRPDWPMWTDNYNNLLQVINWEWDLVK